MKGVVFTELLDHIEAKHGPMFLEALLVDVPLPSGGAYTAVGTYAVAELEDLVEAYAERTDTLPTAVLRTFGQHLFGALATRFRDLVGTFPTARALLQAVDSVIHPIVQRLYPDADLPRFTARDEGGVLQLDYRSAHPLADLAMGLIEGCLRHYGQGGAVVCTRVEGGATFAIEFAEEVACPRT